MYFSHSSNGANQRRDISCQITGAVLATYETGNDASRIAALVTANAAQASTFSTLISGGHVPLRQMVSQYSLEELRAAYQRSIA